MLITVHLYNSQEELVINADHIVSVQPANDNSSNVQMTSGPVFRITENVVDLNELVRGLSAALLTAPETKSAEGGSESVEPTETAAQRKARLKVEAEAAQQ